MHTPRKLDNLKYEQYSREQAPFPIEVSEKWIFGNEPFPDYSNLGKQKEKITTQPTPELQRMIIVLGTENSGKTTAIINVFENLVSKNMAFGKINYTFWGESSIGKQCDDMIVATNIEKLSNFPKFCLGIFSCEDGVNPINPVRDLRIEKARCDVIVCAAQSENPAIYSKLTSFALEEKRHYRTSRVSSPLPPSVSVSTNHYRAGIIATLTDLL